MFNQLISLIPQFDLGMIAGKHHHHAVLIRKRERNGENLYGDYHTVFLHTQRYCADLLPCLLHSCAVAGTEAGAGAFGLVLLLLYY